MQFEYELLEFDFVQGYDSVSSDTILVVREDTKDKKNENVPSIEYDVEGIPMGKSETEVKTRRQLIYSFYERWKQLHPEKAVFNKSLKADILIRQESVVEAAEHAAKRYRSTLAVLRLDSVLAEAVKVNEDVPKPGNKNQSKLVKMLLMSYCSEDLGTIKLTVGVRNRTLDKVQYGITALEEGEVIKPKSKPNNKRASHKK